MSNHFEQIPGRVACITFAASPSLKAFDRDMQLRYPVYGDPGRNVYEAFGFGRGSVARVWMHPRVWVSYARLLIQGRRPSWSGQDTLQLGGNAVLDAAGRVRWVYRSSGPDDRPAPEEIGEQLLRAARGA